MSTEFDDGDEWLEGFLAEEGESALGGEGEAPLWKAGREVGEWTVTGFLARGGSAETYCAKHRRLGMAAAIKVLWRDGAGPRARFDRETAFLMENPGEAFPAFYGAGVEDGRPWVAMELLDECPLPGTDAGVARYLADVGRGVAALHERGWLHRDLKPRNILRRADGRAVLVDFGLLKAIGTNETRVERESPSVVDGREVGVGTPGHSAPEQFAGGGATPAADVYALGMLAEECFGGEPPRAWEKIIRRATGALPRQRYESVEAMLRAIRRRHRARNWGWAGLAVAIAAALAAVVPRVVHGPMAANGAERARTAAVRRAERGGGKGIVEGILRDLAPMPALDNGTQAATYIGRHEVTQAQWEALMEENPSRFKGADLPVDNVTIAECLEFIARLNRMPEVRAAGMAFRLPTEEEWKVAAVGDSSDEDALRFLKLPYSSQEEWFGAGWFRDNSGGTTHSVGQKAANRTGLFDVWGNVAEPTAPPTATVSMDGLFSRQFSGFPCMGGSFRKNVTLFDGVRFVGGDFASLPGEFKSLFDDMEVPERVWERLAADDARRDTVHGETLGLRLFAVAESGN